MHVDTAERRDARRLRGRPEELRVWLLGVLVVSASGYGLLAENAYRSVPTLVEQTWRAQDAVTLASVPVLLWAAGRARAGSLAGHVLAVGVLMWLTYSYAHLALGAPFNPMFLVYVAVLTLAGFGMLDGLLRVDVASTAGVFDRAPRRAAAGFLVVAGLGVGVLWLGDIAVGLAGGTPTGLHLAGLPNPTWVLDLAWIVPTALGTATLLRRRHPAGPLLCGVLLVMLVILSLAMLAVAPFALAAGLGGSTAVMGQLVAFGVVFGVLAAIEAWLLVRGRRAMDPAPPAWRRGSWWQEPSGTRRPLPAT